MHEHGLDPVLSGCGRIREREKWSPRGIVPASRRDRLPCSLETRWLWRLLHGGGATPAWPWLVQAGHL